MQTQSTIKHLRTVITALFIFIAGAVCAQYSIKGATTVDQGDTRSYTFSDYSGSSPNGYYTWYTSNGATISGNEYIDGVNMSTVNVLFNNSGNEGIYVETYDSFNGYNDMISVTVNATANIACTPSSLSFTADQTSGETFNITTNIPLADLTIETSGCVSSATRSNNIVTVKCSRNYNITPRTGSVTVSGSGASTSVSVTQTGEAPDITLSPRSYTFDYAGGTKHFDINTNIDINDLTVDFGGCVDDAYKEGLGLGVKCNPSTMDGEGWVEVSYGTESDRVDIIQYEPRISLSPGSLSFGASGGTDYIDITTNVELTSLNISSPDFITTSRSEDRITVVCPSNNSLDRNEGYIHVSAEGETASTYVSQSGEEPSISLSSHSWSVSSSGGDKTVTITTNIPLSELTITKPDFVTLEQSGTTLELSIDQNDSTSPNNGTVKVSARSTSDELDIHQNGASRPSIPNNSPQVVYNGLCTGKAKLERVGSPPNGENWYWQYNEYGTSTSLGSGQFYEPTTTSYGSGYYYLRAKDMNTGLWSSGSAKSAYVSISDGLLSDFSDVRLDGEGDTYCDQGNTFTLYLYNLSAIEDGTTFELLKNGNSQVAEVTKTSDSQTTLVFKDPAAPLEAYIGTEGTYTVRAYKDACDEVITHLTHTITGETQVPTTPPTFVLEGTEHGYNIPKTYCTGDLTLRTTETNVEWYKDGISTEITTQWYTPKDTGPHVYKLSCTTPHCTGTTTLFSSEVTIVTLPGVAQVSEPTGDTVVCQGTTTSFYSASAPDAESYTWEIFNAGTSTIDPATGTVNWDSGFSGPATIQVTAQGCGTSTPASTIVNVIPYVGPVSIINGPDSRCMGSGTSTYTAEALNAESFKWEIFNARASTIDSITGVVTWDDSFADTATVKVTARGRCEPATTASIDVIVGSAVGSVTAINGTSKFCQGEENSSLYSAEVSNADDYNWEIFNAGASTIDQETGEVNWDSGFSGTATIKVTAYGCNSSSSREKSVEITPALSAGGIGEDQVVSPGTLVTLSLDPPPSGGDGSYEYEWLESLDGTNFEPQGATASMLVTTVDTSVYYRVRVSSGQCQEETNTVFIQTGNPLNPGLICCSDTLAPGQLPQELVSEEPASEGLTPYTYQWEMMDDELLGWITIDNTNSENYLPDLPEKSTWFRRGVSDDMGQQAWTDSVLIYLPSDSIIAHPVSLIENNNTLTVHKGRYGAFGHWEWYDSYKGLPFQTSLDSVFAVGSPSRSTRYRARSAYSIEDPETGEYIPHNSYFVSVPVQADETIQTPSDKNYVLSYSPVKEVTNEAALTSLPLEEQGAVVQYYDGLGRPEQTVAVNQSYFFNDLVTGVEYDSFGRKNMNYIPSSVHGRGAFVNDIGNNIDAFYSGVNGSPVDGMTYHGGSNPDHSLTTYESSPLNRVLSVKDPEGGTITYEYGTNTGAVTIWTVDDSNGLVRGNDYETGELYRTKTTDASGKITEEYKDKLGQVILKVAGGSAKTYYVYDDFGLLRYVLPPEATEEMTGSSYTPASSEVKGLCYYYKYDKRKRMVTKQLPGAEYVFMVYDARDRMVLVQDGNTRDEDSRRYLFTKYDDFNRPVETGWLRMRRGWGISWLCNLFENTIIFPEDCDFEEVITQTAYDTYPSNSLCNLATKNTAVKGQVTWQKALLLDNDEDYQETYTFYDDKYRVIQTNIDNPSGFIDAEIQNSYDFAGNLLQSVEDYSGQVDQEITKFYTYDHAGRLEKVEQEITGDTENGRVVLAQNDYNELGQLTLQKLHCANDTSYIQDIDYLYDVRGWLTQVNNFSDTTRNKLFAQSLDYFSNGNIQGMNWKHALLDENDCIAPANKLEYTFDYDALNRLGNAYYKEYTPEGSDVNTGNFNTQYTYYKNGNLHTLNRKGNRKVSGDTPVYGYIDELTYFYESESNRLEKVRDYGENAYHDIEYEYDSSSEYSYDDNGNAINVPGKGSIDYNYLNLPEEIVADDGTITYIYDALGNKLKKRAAGANTYYQGSVLKIDGQEVILTGEGRVIDNSGTWEYQYDLKDHLGNTRVSFKDVDTKAEPLQYKDYYPFGMEMAQWYNTDPSATKYLYNGKELQDEYDLNWYDYGARFYDPSLGRTHSIDPHADSYVEISPYAFFNNNPLVNIDPTGMDVEYIYDDDGNVTGYKVTGDDIVNYQSMLKHVSSGNSSMSNVYDALDGAAGSNNGDGGAFSSTVGGATAVGEMPDALPFTAMASKQDFRGSNGLLKFLWTGGNIDGWKYDFDGNATGPSPIMGVAPTPGKIKNLGGLWKLTKQGSSAVKYHKTFGTLYKSKSDGLWWALDRAGHGGSKFKVFKESKQGLKWYKDADEFGNFILNKHKGNVGKAISWGQLSTVK